MLQTHVSILIVLRTVDTMCAKSAESTLCHLVVTAQHGSSRTTADQLDHKHLHKALLFIVYIG